MATLSHLEKLLYSALRLMGTDSSRNPRLEIDLVSESSITEHQYRREIYGNLISCKRRQEVSTHIFTPPLTRGFENY